MPVRVYLTDENMTAYLMGEIDHHSAKAIREEIDETAGRAHPEELILDFKDVTFMDSSGIGLVMGRYALMQELGGTLRVTGQSAHIRKVMKLAGLDRLAVMDGARATAKKTDSTPKKSSEPVPSDTAAKTPVTAKAAGKSTRGWSADKAVADSPALGETRDSERSRNNETPE